MENKMIKTLIMSIALIGALSGCTVHEPSAERKQGEQLKQSQAEMQRQIGMPDIKNFQERKFAKMILELRDKGVSTYTYFIDMHGKKHFICNSVGYGLPYAVQYVSPLQLAGLYNDHTALPQAEPNGLYMPDSLSATWILCSKNGEVKPLYVEPQIIVSPFKLGGV